uniref:C3H1-type domain-containing protein n=1 Tax=Alexandrium catenella TaxID=2925 RepID=A0A7S1QC49_ALECA|mmetsp:Transcript_24440/g.66730  ORF Transcript_24440/g.66730 Transcript_24440/m.66730 type:complete len:364 (+) Transcript_24440:65-1156(+)
MSNQCECAVHGKMRSLQSLVPDDGGGMRCAPGSECKIGGDRSACGPYGGAGGVGNVMCSVHCKLRSSESLVNDGWGNMRCAPGKECKVSSDKLSASGGTVKRSLCKFWQEGRCTQGDSCTYAHGEHELGTSASAGAASGAAAKGDSWKGGGRSWKSLMPGDYGKGGGWKGGMDPGYGMDAMWKGGGSWKGGMDDGWGDGWGFGDMAAMWKGMGPWGKGMGKMNPAMMMMGKGMGMMGWGGMGGGMCDWAGGSSSSLDDKPFCSIHKKQRSANCLEDNGDGTFRCRDGMQCKVNSTKEFGTGVKRTLCKFYESGTCTKGDRCTYAHSESEIGEPIPGDGGEMDSAPAYEGSRWSGSRQQRYSPY